MERSRKNQSSFGNNNGFYNFGDTTANPFDAGFGFANAALGVYQTMDQALNYINGEYRYWNIEEFVQDTWKVTPRLTFDYGVRLSWYQPQYDASLQASTFLLSKWDPSQAPRLYQPQIVNGVRSAVDPATGQVLPGYDIGLEVPNTGNPFNGIVQAGKGYSKYLQDNRGPQWGPRFGIAWDVTGLQNVVVRTGGGIYYDRFQGNRVFDMVRNPPEGLDPSLTYGLAQNINPNNIILAPPTLYAADPKAKLPTTYYQFSIQAKLPWNLVLDAAYVADVGRHLQDNRQPQPHSVRRRLPAPEPGSDAGVLCTCGQQRAAAEFPPSPPRIQPDRPVRKRGDVKLQRPAAQPDSAGGQSRLFRRVVHVEQSADHVDFRHDVCPG
jgi:hypothetical protein